MSFYFDLLVRTRIILIPSEQILLKKSKGVFHQPTKYLDKNVL